MSAPIPTLSLWQASSAIITRDLRLLWRRRAAAIHPILFALLIVVLFALGLGPKPQQLADAAPTILWITVLLASLLTLDTLFRADVEDGTMEQWLLSPLPLAWLIAVRIACHWTASVLPLIIITPLLGAFLQLPHEQLPIVMASLLLGTPLLSLLGAVIAALTVTMPRAGILVALLALPLYVPVLIFGTGSITAATQGHDSTGALLLLGAGLALGTVLAPLTAAAAIRISLS
ncbi:heme exporter protein CcmB [Xylella fastidiosa]|uniref:heme exporter protein CcmB n=1 Tax=Xylella fastidiosa TaxID=2371 RepID=UPI0009835CE9|nr:heme exporter protein CcmB [Xylella fastidiosa]WGZ34868.1 heme exporter protein CcmB [Xylella fastidiosa subsp. pauca]WGZ37145.1 heme exporter protein CcmB [Xylella fastidiosa subsp. pauca]